MKYFVVEGTFKDTISIDKSELQIAIADHLAYLDKGFEDGFIFHESSPSLFYHLR